MLRYELRVHFGPMDSAGGPVLSVDLDQFTAAGRFEATQIRLWELEPPSRGSGGGGLVPTLASRDCSVMLEAGGARGSLSCRLDPGDEEHGLRRDATHVEASWQATAVTMAAGSPVQVTWALGDRYVSSGTAIGWPDLTLEPNPGLYFVPDVRLRGEPFAPEYLRILIRGYSGDGKYSGDSVDPSIQDAHGDSPNIVSSAIHLAAAHPLYLDCPVCARNPGPASGRQSRSHRHVGINPARPRGVWSSVGDMKPGCRSRTTTGSEVCRYASRSNPLHDSV